MEHTEIAEIDSFCAWSKYCPSISPEQLLHIRRSANALAAFSKDCVLCMMESMVLCMDLPMMEGGDGVLIVADRCTHGDHHSPPPWWWRWSNTRLMLICRNNTLFWKSQETLALQYQILLYRNCYWEICTAALCFYRTHAHMGSDQWVAFSVSIYLSMRGFWNLVKTLVEELKTLVEDHSWWP